MVFAMRVMSSKLVLPSSIGSWGMAPRGVLGFREEASDIGGKKRIADVVSRGLAANRSRAVTMPFRLEVVMLQRAKAVLDIVSTLAIVALAGAVFWKVYFDAPARSAARVAVEDVKGLSISSDRLTHTQGQGQVVLVEFADYECPFCIKSRMIDSGTVQRVFFNFPLAMHSNAQKASEAAECAAVQGRFWEMHEQLFSTPSALDTPDLVRHAEAIGIDLRKFRTCLEGNGAVDRVQADVEEGRRLGVESTPTFFIGTRQHDGTVQLLKRINGAVPLDVFVRAVDDVKPKAGASE
jgi:protein-disulfide isomerase